MLKIYSGKLLLLTPLLYLICLLPNASAQDYYGGYGRNMRIGLAINPSYNWLQYDNDYSVTPQVGFSYGLLADFGFTDNYYFATGLLINSINSRVETGNQPHYLDRDIYLKYVEVPLALKLKTAPRYSGRFYGLFGFTLGVKVSGREQLAENDRRTNIDGDDLFRLGLQIGTGYEWNISDNLGFQTGLTYNNGFTRAITQGSPRTNFVALNFALLF